MCSSTAHRLTLRDPNSTTFNFPPLDTWAEQRLTAVTTAPSQGNFTTAFDNFISKNVSVTFNGVPLTRAEYEQQLLGEISAEGLAVIDILNIVQAAEFNKKATQKSGVVGMFYNLTFVQSFGERTIQSSLDILVDEDKSIDGHCGQVDQRRVVSLDQVLLDQAGGHGPVIPPNSTGLD